MHLFLGGLIGISGCTWAVRSLSQRPAKGEAARGAHPIKCPTGVLLGAVGCGGCGVPEGLGAAVPRPLPGFGVREPGSECLRNLGARPLLPPHLPAQPFAAPCPHENQKNKAEERALSSDTAGLGLNPAKINPLLSQQSRGPSGKGGSRLWGPRPGGCEVPKGWQRGGGSVSPAAGPGNILGCRDGGAAGAEPR